MLMLLFIPVSELNGKDHIAGKLLRLENILFTPIQVLWPSIFILSQSDMKCTVMIWRSWVRTLVGLNLGCVVGYFCPKSYLNQKYCSYSICINNKLVPFTIPSASIMLSQLNGFKWQYVYRSNNSNSDVHWLILNTTLQKSLMGLRMKHT